jgi:hypothetical protein
MLTAEQVAELLVPESLVSPREMSSLSTAIANAREMEPIP